MAKRSAARSPTDKKGRTKAPECDRSFGGFSEAWMPGFIADALDSLNIVATGRKHGVSLADLIRHRADDPAFDAACRDVERSMDLAIRETLRGEAANGNPRAASLLLRRQRELDTIAQADAQEVPPPHVARAMITAGLLASKCIGREEARCPHCRQMMPGCD